MTIDSQWQFHGGLILSLQDLVRGYFCILVYVYKYPRELMRSMVIINTEHEPWLLRRPLKNPLALDCGRRVFGCLLPVFLS
jgi:hypothetical protein